MADFEATVASVAELDEARPWVWRSGTLNVRESLYRTVEDAQAALVTVAADSHPESRRILALAQRAFGDLRGLLIGLPGELLDQVPRAGEWSVQETLHHVLSVERRYAAQTVYAPERTDVDPVRIPEDRLPTAAQTDAGGNAADLLARLGQARAETNRRLGDVAPAAMTRPSVWVNNTIDVRFRLHRFAAHLAEHTIQCDKTLAALGWRPA
jgi:hypothetical protein